MTIERGVLLWAGIVVLLSVALTYWVSPLWVWLTVFAGVNMVQSSFTGFCPITYLMRAVGMKTEREKALEG